MAPKLHKAADLDPGQQEVHYTLGVDALASRADFAFCLPQKRRNSARPFMPNADYAAAYYTG